MRWINHSFSVLMLAGFVLAANPSWAAPGLGRGPVNAAERIVDNRVAHLQKFAGQTTARLERIVDNRIAEIENLLEIGAVEEAELLADETIALINSAAEQAIAHLERFSQAAAELLNRLEAPEAANLVLSTSAEASAEIEAGRVAAVADVELAMSGGVE